MSLNIYISLISYVAAFDMIGHDHLFYMLERYVGFGDSALRLILCHMFVWLLVCVWGATGLSSGTNAILFVFTSTCCDAELGTIRLAIGYHIYADDTQLYISFQCEDSLESLTKLNMCISEIRVWMIKNDSKKRIDNFLISTFETKFEWFVFLCGRYATIIVF